MIKRDDFRRGIGKLIENLIRGILSKVNATRVFAGRKAWT